MSDTRMQAAIDRVEINALLLNWGQARDRGDWPALRECFQPDGTIHIAWISGPAEDFVERSAGMLAAEHDRGFAKHVITPNRVRLNGRRAFSQCHVNFPTRAVIDDIEFDWEFWGQFYDLLEKRDDDQWRIFRRTMVYEKDRLDPVDPSKLPDGYFAAMNLEQYPHQVRFTHWRLAQAGRTPMPDMVLSKTDEAEKLLTDSLTWLDAN